MTEKNTPLVFTKEFTKQEPIPEQGIERAVELLRSGRLHRYNVAAGEVSEVAVLEKEFADYVGTRYCAAFSSCGSSIYVALLSAGVKPGDKVLCNAFTLAPVPGAIQNAGAVNILVEVTEDYTIDLEDLEKKAEESHARFLLMSHMRGHFADMDAVTEICTRRNITLIEDCAHTMGAKWGEKFTGTFGKAGCFSTQTYKHMNSGEGGLLVTDDPEVAAQAILYSGSYMLYERHIARPEIEVFERFKKVTPNFSLRMSNLQAALLRPQLRDIQTQCNRWNERYRLLESALAKVDHVRVPRRKNKEHYVGSSIQFTLTGVNRDQVEAFLAECGRRGVEIKWFGWKEPNGFTSSFDSWQYMATIPEMPKTKYLLDFMCDFRIPLTFSLEDCETIALIIGQAAAEVF